MEAHSSPAVITDPKLALAYLIQARRNTVTFHSVASGARFTFQIQPSDKKQAKEKGAKDLRFWVKFLCGQDNENDYRYLGQILNGRFSLTKKSLDSGLSEKTPAYIAFKTSFDALVAGRMPGWLEVIPSGRCARCGRKITVPDSVKDGFGPECINYVLGVKAPVPVAQIDTKAAEAMQREVKATGVAAPQQGNLYRALDQSVTKPAVKASGTPAVPNVGSIDAEIKRRIAEYAANDQESYTMDGELTPQQAYNVAYNKFRLQIEREGK